MLTKVLALSAAIGAHGVAVTSATALCTALTTGFCGSFNHFPQPNPTVGTCATLMTAAIPTLGDDTDANTNSVGCRQKFAVMASTTNQSYWCQYAGFTGGGLCGSVLDNTCTAITNGTCNGVTGATWAGASGYSSCMTNLSTLVAVFGSKVGAAAAAENSLECRMYHSLVGWNQGAAGAEAHCTHVTSTGGTGWCASGLVSTNTDHYCSMITTFCTKTSGGVIRTQWNSIDDCQASFPAFSDGDVNPGNVANDRGCRQYHANAAATGVAPGDAHCHHGGPSGGGVCNNSTAAWVSLAQVASCKANASYAYVSTSILAAFNNWNRSDLTAIIPVGTDLSTYSVGAVGDTDTCRLYHMTVASRATSHCDHGSILGGNNCGTPVAAACRVFQTACGTTAFADTSACTTAVTALLALNKTGTPSMSASSTDDLACRMYQAGLALVSKTMTSAGAAVTAACNGVKSPGSTICGSSTPIKSSATPVVASVLLAFLPLLAL